jgi:hypothetical protein
MSQWLYQDYNRYLQFFLPSYYNHHTMTEKQLSPRTFLKYNLGISVLRFLIIILSSYFVLPSKDGESKPSIVLSLKAELH